MPEKNGCTSELSDAKEEPGEETMAGFVNRLTSLPRSAKFERVDVEFDPEEKWRDQK